MKVQIIGGAIFAILLGIVGWAGVLVADRQSPVTDVKITTLVSNNPGVTGDWLEVDIVVFYRKSCTTDLRRQVYDAKGVMFALPELVLPPTPPGLRHSVSRFPLPAVFAGPDGRYVSNVTYRCNWTQYFWPIRAPERVADFVIPPEKKDPT